MRRHSVGGAFRFITVTALSTLMGLAAVAAPASAASTKIGHNGEAYGTSAKVSSVFSSSPTALVGLGCTNVTGLTHTSSALSGGFLTAGFVGAINDQVGTTKDGTSAGAQVGSVSLFSAEVTADAFTVTASVTHGDSGFTFAGDTVATNFSVNGSPMAAPAPNTVVPIPGVGTLTINEQITKQTATTASITVNALDLHVDVTNAFNFPVGADLVVGHAQAGITTTPTRYVAGQAYGAQVQGTGLNAGRTALIFLPCQGTNGNVRTHSLQSTTVPNVITIGSQVSTVSGFGSKQSASATETESVQNVSLINLISIDSMKAVANASSFEKTTTFNDTGTTFSGVSVLGVPTIPDQVPPNSMYSLPGVGTLYLHRIIQTAHKIEVRMIELVLSAPVGPLTAGTDIRIGVAVASVHTV